MTDHILSNNSIINLLSEGNQEFKRLLESKAAEADIHRKSKSPHRIQVRKGDNRIVTASGELAVGDATHATNRTRPRFALWFDEQAFVRTGDVVGNLASAHDAKTRLVTVSTAQMVHVGLLEHDHDLVQGDQLATTIDGRLVVWKVNRRAAQTLAAHLPEGLEVPTAIDGVFQRTTYRVTILGPLKTAQVVYHLSDSPLPLNHAL